MTFVSWPRIIRLYYVAARRGGAGPIRATTTAGKLALVSWWRWA